MQRIRLWGIVTVVLLGACGDVAVRAQENDNQRERSGRREGRRGFGGRGFGRGGFGGGAFGAREGGLLGLLRIDEVREELSVNDDQQELIRILGDDLREGRPDFPENYRNLSDAERNAFRTKMDQWQAKQEKEAKATLATILEPQQHKRLMEISIQVQGVDALTDEDVAGKLELSDDQKTKIAATIDENRDKSREQMREAFAAAREGGDRPDFSAMREKMESIRKENDKRVLAHLTEEQKTAFEAMKGEAFDMPERRFGRGRGGFGRGRGGPGRGDRPDRPSRPE